MDLDAPAAGAGPASDPAPSRLRLLLRAFAHPNYRLFFAGQLVSLVGTFLAQVALVWVVYRLTHDPFLLGVVAFASQVPQFVVTPFAGVWADRVNRRRLLVLTQTLSMLQSFALGVLALWGWLSADLIVALALFQGIVNAFDLPTRQAFLVEIVTDRRDLPNAIALNSTMVHFARLIGPAAAGMLLYWVGAGWCFLIDGFSYLAVIGSLMAMRVAPRPAVRTRRSVLHELREGLLYVWGFPPIRALLILMAVISFAGLPAFSTLVPVFADHFGGERNGSRVLGFLMAASGLGALVGAVYLAGRRTVVGLGGVICLAATVFGLALIAFSFSRSVTASMLIVPVLGWAMLLNFAPANTLLQTLADEDKRGRVMSFFTMAFIGVAPFGSLAAGALAGRLGRSAGIGGVGADHLAGAAYTLRLCGALCLIAAVAFALMLPRLRRIAHPVYVAKGLLPPDVPAETAAGLGSATQVVSTQTNIGGATT